MEITSYRLVKKKHVHRAFDGEGARLYGGALEQPGGFGCIYFGFSGVMLSLRFL